MENKGNQNCRKVGAAYEKKAAAFLEARGFRIVEHNFRCRTGEIDLIAREGGVLVFIEVKYRRTESFGTAVEAVTPGKQRTICRVADYYRVYRKIPDSQPCRFDVVAITGERTELIRNAFYYQ